VKVIDFGLAKAIGEKLVEASLFTEAGRVVGTPEYMAPEQADPTNRDVDTRADVYSLGVMLYELLVGSLPFATAELRRAGAGELRRVLAEIETPRPSIRLAGDRDSSLTIAAARRTTPSSLHRELRNDLDWVVLKAIEKDRDRRYDSARALADELQRYLDREPLLAGPPSTGYRLKKFVARNRGAVAAVTAVLVTAGLGTVVATQFAFAASASERLANRKAEEAMANERLASERAAENERLATSLREQMRKSEPLVTLATYQQASEMDASLYPAWPDKARLMEAWILMVDVMLGHHKVQKASEWRQPSPSTNEDVSTKYLRESLRRLEPKLERLATIERPAMARRLAWANALAGMARGHPLATHSWAEVRAAIAANPCYSGCSIELADDDVFDLAPIGENPVTHLWEFYHLRSAWDREADPRTIPIPEILPDGSITMTPSTGIVFVLLPGGTFWMGAQGTDESGRNFDRDAAEDERLHAVTLPPFFLARHELTRGQWSRLAGTSPFAAREGFHADGDPEPVGALHPAETISWQEANSWLGRYGLRLPTEAEWEYGCRGGTSTPWWSGNSPADLQDCANILDQQSGPRRPLPATPPSPTEDPFRHIAPVGRFRANPFGLFDVHGNVWEWCQEPGDRYDPSAGLGYWVELPADRYRATRGGSAQDVAGTVRSSGRLNNEASVTYNLLGLRAARSLHPH
ncbi:MAG: SUMF1/EgtB/PvdO family nonheme iron enzyme, partial [Planctomycetes bacterium]|nr:SUMF1/EgtB/PvdO family nonheme iron enzyme [Planctomycetota bacterium]